MMKLELPEGARFKRDMPSYITAISFLLTIAGTVAAVSVTWGHVTTQVETQNRRLDIQSAKIDVHSSQLEAIHIQQAVTNTKLDNIKETLDQIKQSVDDQRTVQR
jgi:hypothetical protein